MNSVFDNKEAEDIFGRLREAVTERRTMAASHLLLIWIFYIASVNRVSLQLVAEPLFARKLPYDQVSAQGRLQIRELPNNNFSETFQSVLFQCLNENAINQKVNIRCSIRGAKQNSFSFSLGCSTESERRSFITF